MIALTAEVYALNMLVISLCIYAAAGFILIKSNRWLYFLFFLLGLGSGVHHTLILLLLGFAPLLLFPYASPLKHRFYFPKRLLLVLLVFSLGASVYLYLPVRASRDPMINWGDAKRLDSFIYHTSRAQYGKLDLYQRSIPRTYIQLRSILEQLTSDLCWFIVFLGFIGLIPTGSKWLRWLRRSKLNSLDDNVNWIRALIMILFLLLFIGIIFLINFNPEGYDFFLVRYFLIPLQYFLLLGVFLFLLSIARIIAKLSIRTDLLIMFLAVMAVVAISIIVSSINGIKSTFYPPCGEFTPSYYGKYLMQSIKQGDILLAADDIDLFTLVYLLLVEGYGKNIRFYDISGMMLSNFTTPYYKASSRFDLHHSLQERIDKLLHANDDSKIFITWRFPPNLATDGINFKLAGKREGESRDSLPPLPQPCPGGYGEHYLYNNALMRLYFKRFLYHDRRGEVELAEAALACAEKVGKDDPDFYTFMGYRLFAQGRHDRAIECLQQAINAYPASLEANCLIYQVYKALNRIDDALKAKRRCLELQDKLQW